ncbi:MAG: hypothetical protein ACUVTQ_11030 [Desulfotomaculales bacterium]
MTEDEKGRKLVGVLAEKVAADKPVMSSVGEAREKDKVRRAVIGHIFVRLCPGCPRRGQGIAEDLAQETLLACHKHGVALVQANWGYIKKAAGSNVADCRRRNREDCFGRSEPESSSEPAHPLPDPWEFERLWELLAKCGGPPWELASFVWVKLLEWRPEELVRDYSGTPVKELLEQGIRQYARVVGRKFKSMCAPFTAALASAPSAPLKDFLAHKDGPARAVTYAVDNVRRRILRCLGEKRR